MEYLIDYGMFLAKAATIVIAIVIVVGAIAATGSKQKKSGKKGSLKITRLNDHLEEMRETLRKSVLDKDHLKVVHKEEKKQAKAEQKDRKAQIKQEQQSETTEDDQRKKRVYVLNFKGNLAADAVASLREEITAILSMAETKDEVILRLESPGGMVHAYGLASSQLVRIKNEKIPLTICVDKVAASGGYMMACLADRLVAAPFAIIGSIGVLVQLPNFNRVLKKLDVDYEQISAGEYKRTLSVFGEITEKGREKVQEDVENIHDIFKHWVKDHRPSIEIDKISTGETWVGTQAKERYMVDEIKTSDECVVEACADAEVFEVEFEFKKSIQEKIGGVLEESSSRFVSRWFERSTNDIYQ
ncbi:MAG: protease SohB [Pseudomonadales bacterium]|nr:protease SohB [Pseudomonadales bacterium]